VLMAAGANTVMVFLMILLVILLVTLLVDLGILHVLRIHCH